MHSGVYKIVNKATGDEYIGSAAHFQSRWKAHIKELRGGRHHSPYLQRSWNKHGENAFEFKKLLVCSRQNLLVYEQLLLDALQPKYNTCKIANNRLGVGHDTAAKQRISERSKRLWRDKRDYMLSVTRIGQEKMLHLRKDPAYRALLKQKTCAGRRKNAKTLTYNSVTKSLREWAEEYNIPDTTLHNRLRSGWTTEQAITTPVFEVNSKEFFDARREKRGQPIYDYKGQKMGLVELANALGVDKSQLWRMLRKRGLEDTIAYYEAVAEGSRPKTLRNVVCEYNGKPQSLLTLCEEFGAPYPTLSRRVKRYGLEETIKYYEAKRA